MMTSDNKTIDRLNQLIDDNLDNPTFSADTICQTLGISRSNLYRLIKEQSQLSTSLYIRQRRLEKARELLKNKNLRVVEVAEQIGIANPQNFSKYFTETFGLSPTEYRKEINAGSGAASPLPAGTGTPTETSIDPPILPTPSSSVRYPFRRIGIGGFLLIILGALGWYVWQAASTGATGLGAWREPDNSIAVLPFQNLGSSETAYFSEGVAEQIHSTLTLIEPLRVISRTSTLHYATTTRPVAEIARELGVNYLLEGRVQRLANRVKLSVELIRASENQTVWAKTYEGEPKDIVGFTRTIARQVAGELHQTLSTVLQKKIDRVPTQNPDAFTEFLKGQFLMRNRTKAGLESSLTNFDRAIALDSTFAEAYATKALVYFLIATEGYGDASANIRRAEHYALATIKLDPENALAYAMLANLYKQQNRWEQASTSYQIALRYRPNDALINYWYSLTLRSVGKLDEAIDYSTKALSLDPLYPVIMIGHIGNLSYAGRFEEAQQTIREGQRLHGTLYAWYWAVGFYYVNRGQSAPALQAFEQGLTLNPASDGFRVMIAYMKALTGQSDPARTLLKSLPDLLETYADRATLYAGLGDRERCLYYLEKGAEAGVLPGYLKVSPIFRFLHGEPRFQAVLQRVGLDDSTLKTL